MIQLGGSLASSHRTLLASFSIRSTLISIRQTDVDRLMIRKVRVRVTGVLLYFYWDNQREALGHACFIAS